MYVAPTPFALAEGTAHHCTLILPDGMAVDDDLIDIARLTRREVMRVVVAYDFDLRSNELKTKRVRNPNAGTEHVFRAYRPQGDPTGSVTLRERSREKAEKADHGSFDGEDDGGGDDG